MIDKDGYRLNVGIIVMNGAQELLWAKRRYSQDAWQFPQGGIHPNETSIQAMYRELREELGLEEDMVSIVAETQDWHLYHLPEKYQRKHTTPICIGQKQRWFLLKLSAADDAINLSYSPKPEFSDWKWVEYWMPLEQVIDFKYQVYKDVLTEFAVYLK